MREKVKQLVLSQGADVCGIANISHFKDVPPGCSPTDLYCDCRSVIVFGVALPKGLLRVNPRLIYEHFNGASCAYVDAIAFAASKRMELELQSYAVPLPSDSPYEYWDEEKKEGHGLLSMKHAAVLAGLGSLGKNTLLIHPVYGNVLTIGAILTNLELPSDELCPDICLAGCHKCIDSCPVQAIADGDVNQKLCRSHTYGRNKRGFETVNCNICRNVCPLKYGIQ